MNGNKFFIVKLEQDMPGIVEPFDAKDRKQAWEELKNWLTNDVYLIEVDEKGRRID